MRVNFKQGDIITRDGTDEHIIEDVYYDGCMLVVRCIKEPNEKWIELGETEHNLSRRYTLVREKL